MKPRHYSKVWALPAFQIQELWNLYIPIGRTRQRYEQSHDISLNKLYVTEGSFLGLAHCLYKRKKTKQKNKTRRTEWESSVPNQLVTHPYKPTVSWQTTCFHFLSHPRARILIHFSRDSTGNRKDGGIKIFIYTFVVVQNSGLISGQAYRPYKVSSIT